MCRMSWRLGMIARRRRAATAMSHCAKNRSTPGASQASSSTEMPLCFERIPRYALQRDLDNTAYAPGPKLQLRFSVQFTRYDALDQFGPVTLLSRFGVGEGNTALRPFKPQVARPSRTFRTPAYAHACAAQCERAEFRRIGCQLMDCQCHH